MKTRMIHAIAAAAFLIAGQALTHNAYAQDSDSGSSANGSSTATATSAPAEATPPAVRLQYFRPQDQRGLNVFEAPKEPGVPYTGFQLDFGGAFTQQFQSLSHTNNAYMVDGENLTELKNIGAGFNNATANLNLNAQIAEGIRVSLTAYLSSRHHTETWVKDGYLLVDASPIDVDVLNSLMEYVTLRLGHFEINYGDAHFRRSDNGNAMYNPFVGNYIMDAFTTEVGGEIYVRSNGLMAMFGITGGEIRGNITNPDGRAATYLGKLGFDRQLTDALRVRLTGSVYTTDKSLNNTLYTGDRAGSRYYFVLEDTEATEAANAKSGLINPGLRSEVTAFQFNPFVKFNDLELFGVIEQAEGKAANEGDTRKWNQYAGDAVYRFLDDALYLGARYNVVTGQLAGMTDDVKIDRTQFGAGWFITNNLLLKGEYVRQWYHDYPTGELYNGGSFRGFMVEGIVSF